MGRFRKLTGKEEKRIALINTLQEGGKWALFTSVALYAGATAVALSLDIMKLRAAKKGGRR